MDNLDNNSGAEGKTFTQEDVNRIVGERLAKEKAKASQDLEAREKELAAKEMQFKAKSALADKGYSSELLDAIKCGSDEELNKSLEILSRVIGQKEDSSNTNSGKEDIKIPRFTAPLKGRSRHGIDDDPIRKAMNLPHRKDD